MKCNILFYILCVVDTNNKYNIKNEFIFKLEKLNNINIIYYFLNKKYKLIYIK